MIMFSLPTTVKGWRKSRACEFGNEGRRDGKLMRKYDSENVDIIMHATPNTAVNCFQTTISDTYHTISAINNTPDDKVITPSKLKAKRSEYNDLSENQRDQLL
jgi:hypothetical protein